MELKLKDLRAQNLSKRITVEGTVIKTGNQYPFCTKAAFQCIRCGHMHFVDQESFKLEEPFAGCENETCVKKGTLKLLTENSTFIDAQDIEICDYADDGFKYEECRKVQLNVILIGDAVGKTHLEQNFKFTGKFTTSEIGKGKLEYLLYADTIESKSSNVSSETTITWKEKIRLIKNCVRDVSAKYPGSKAPLEEVYQFAENNGIAREQTKAVILQMKQIGDLLSPDADHIRLV
jgi:DNA replicative helicase MCM subunit Mcm2 (Cdc46/Mcm family)